MKILHNATIYTLEDKIEMVEAIAIKDNKILAIGDFDTLCREFGHINNKIDLQGKTVIPGITDAHIHLEKYAFSIMKVDCETESKSECLQRIDSRIQMSNPGEWILGHGWNQNNWPEGYGSKSDLDKISLQHPIYLTAKSLHAAWANTKALHTAGITSDTPDPQGGKIGREANGEPDGILYENAMKLVSQVIPAPSIERTAHAISQAIMKLWSYGITGAHDFDQRLCFQALQVLNENSNLKFRVIKSIPFQDLDHVISLGLRTGFGNDYLKIGCVKAFADGALGPRTAAMLSPYKGDPENRGMLLMDAEELYEHGRLAVEAGLGMAIHAIGDRANHEVLKAFTQIRKYERSLNRPTEIKRLRHRIEHVQVIHPQDSPVLAQLGIIPSMQPIHATSDMLMADKYWGDRTAHAYAWKTQLNHGAILTFGSDAPVESPNPFLGLYAAVTRRKTDGFPSAHGWIPDQKLTIKEAINAYTKGAAYAASNESSQGKLIPGYFADLVVLDVDPFRCDPAQIKDIKPRATMVSGSWVFGYK